MQLENPRHESFCQRVANGQRGSLAYAGAYNKPVSQSTATGATQLLKRQDVQDRVAELVDAASKRLTWSVEDGLQELLTIANADPAEVVPLRVGACRYCHGEGHQYQWKQREYLEALEKGEKKNPPEIPDIAGGFGYMRSADPHPDCPECEGEGVQRVIPINTDNLTPAGRMLYEGSDVDRFGAIKIKLADRQRARETALRIRGAFIERKEIDVRGVIRTDPISLLEDCKRLGLDPASLGLDQVAADE